MSLIFASEDERLYVLCGFSSLINFVVFKRLIYILHVFDKCDENSHASV